MTRTTATSTATRARTTRSGWHTSPRRCTTWRRGGVSRCARCSTWAPAWGMWRDWYRTNHPGVFLQSIDVSEHACATWGHDQLDIAEWRPSAPFDLVICHSVLQYIDDDRVVRAIEHLATATRHVIYLEIPTTHDLLHTVDPERTDLHIFRRDGDWYRHAAGAPLPAGGCRPVGAARRHADVRTRGQPLILGESLGRAGRPCGTAPDQASDARSAAVDRSRAPHTMGDSRCQPSAWASVSDRPRW